MAHDGQILFKKPLLAIIKSALVELESHSTMKILFEKYGFEHSANPDFTNKINRASSFLDHQDWSNSTNTEKMIELLTETYLKYQHLLGHAESISNNSIHGLRIMDKALRGSGINWNGTNFDIASGSHFNTIKEFRDLDLNHIRIEVERARGSASKDPADAMTAAENIVVSTCKGILEEYKKAYSLKATPMQLLYDTFDCLGILPENISDASKGKEAAKKTLRSIGASVQGLSELRNLYGDAHGKAPGFIGLEGRHARLLIGMSESIAVFLVETHMKNKSRTNMS